jgi:hypothetical protein
VPRAPYRGEFSERADETVSMPMPDGWRRPLWIAALEDKILQGAMAEVLNAIYETDFRGLPTGFGLCATSIKRWMQSRSRSNGRGELGARRGHP